MVKFISKLGQKIHDLIDGLYGRRVSRMIQKNKEQILARNSFIGVKDV